jgi:hypothetical protein
VEHLEILPKQDGSAYAAHPHGYTEYRVRGRDGTESLRTFIIDYVYKDWAPDDTIRVEGYLQEGSRFRGVIAQYQLESPHGDDKPLGFLEIQDT